MRTSILTAVLVLLGAHDAAAQHAHSPYAGMETAEGTALTAEEIRQLRSGEGMRLALPAELNHYPGPKHLLELRDSLALTPAQIVDIEAIGQRMRTEAIRKGEEIIAVEAHLAGAFRTGTATPDDVDRMTEHLGSLKGQLQAIHLKAHLSARLRLTDGQVQRYDQLRGYGSPPPAEGSLRDS